MDVDESGADHHPFGRDGHGGLGFLERAYRGDGALLYPHIGGPARPA